MQSNIVHSVTVGKWTAHVLDRNKSPMNHGVAESCRYMVRLDHPNGFNTDWPIRYDDGRIAYDSYYASISLASKAVTVSAYLWINQQLAANSV